MIPLNIEDPEVLRRTLEELEQKIPSTDKPITPVSRLELTADLATTVAKVNQLVDSLRTIITQLELNSTNKLA